MTDSITTATISMDALVDVAYLRSSILDAIATEISLQVQITNAYALSFCTSNDIICFFRKIQFNICEIHFTIFPKGL